MPMYNERIYIFFQYRSRRLNMKLYAAVFCWVDRYIKFLWNWTELAAVAMDDFLTFHKLQWFKTSLESFMTNNRCNNDGLHLRSCLMYAPTAVDSMSVVALNLGAGLVADLWSQMVWGTLPYWHYRMVCGYICWKLTIVALISNLTFRLWCKSIE